MYTALLLMLAGIMAGRVFRRFIAGPHLARVVFLSVLFLLFTLGISVGANAALFENLPAFGGAALLIALFALAGSLVLSGLLQKFLRVRGML